MARARRLAVPALVLLPLLVAAPALAAWGVPSVGAEGFAAATAVQPPVAGTPTTTSSSVTLTWAAPAGGPVPTGYTVLRTAPSPAAVCVGVAALTCTDTGLSPSTAYTYAITATRAGWSSAAATASATTAATLPSAFLVTVPATATAGASFSVTVQARKTDGTNDDTYTGSHALAFTGPGTVGSFAPVYPATATFDATGLATVTVRLYKAETVTLTVADGDPDRTGVSGLVAVAPAAPNRLMWAADAAGLVNACPAGTVVVGAGGQRTWRVAVLDQYGNRAVEGPTDRTVSLSRPGGGGASAGTVSAPSLVVPAGASPAVTSASVTLKLKKKSPADTAFRAASAGVTRADCTLAVA